MVLQVARLPAAVLCPDSPALWLGMSFQGWPCPRAWGHQPWLQDRELGRCGRHLSPRGTGGVSPWPCPRCRASREEGPGHLATQSGTWLVAGREQGPTHRSGSPVGGVTISSPGAPQWQAQDLAGLACQVPTLSCPGSLLFGGIIRSLSSRASRDTQAILVYLVPG